jgi:hypothetical protein
LVEQLSSDAKRDPRLQESLTRLEDKLKHETVRQAEFTQRLGTVEYWLAQVRKSLAQTPNQTVLTRLREELTRIQTDLVHAAELARMEPERTRVVAIKEAAAPDESGTLYVVTRQPSGEKPVLKAIGRYDRKAAIVDGSAGSSLVEGRPVFLELP